MVVSLYKGFNLLQKYWYLVLSHWRNTTWWKKKELEKKGLIDRFLKKLPEIHVKGYSYCRPNTNLEIRLARGEVGINELDCACMNHDIAYAENSDLKSRCMADKSLILRAIKRIYAKDSRIGERFTAALISFLISVKMFLCKMELVINSVG